ALVRQSILASRIWIREAPLELVRQGAPLDLRTLEEIDAMIAIDAPENTRDSSQVSQERLAAAQASVRPAYERVFSGALRWVGCQYPTPALAQDAGMATEEFEDFLYGACLLDWEAERARMQRQADRFGGPGRCASSATAPTCGSASLTARWRSTREARTCPAASSSAARWRTRP